MGFDRKEDDFIFEIFHRAQRAKDNFSSGIGLALIRRAIRHMHGKAWTESESDNGATFYVQVPK
ncbi:MAG TPA: ATP-binding protein [Syntrophorhabdaceae bacterium]|nr:ATP-binding protein [Syntrophorhabdaceae bacterium]